MTIRPDIDIFADADRAKPFFVERCSYRVARQSVNEYHYSGGCTTTMYQYAVFEHGELKGAIAYARGAAPNIASPFGLDQSEMLELVRVALDDHVTPTSKAVAVTLRLLKRDAPGVRLCVSYADTKQGHTGTIYKAGNWVCLGETHQSYLRVHGELYHPKTLHGKYKGKPAQSVKWLRANIDPAAERVEMPPKIKYVFPLDRSLSPMLQRMAKECADKAKMALRR